MEILGKEEKSKKTPLNFYCDKCDFKCSYSSDWHRHIGTRKHLTSKDGNVPEIKITSNQPTSLNCDICNRCYKSISGLWKHKKNRKA